MAKGAREMNIKEIHERLDRGELLYCPECDLYHEESGVCDIIICENPFIGYSELSIEAHQELITKNFKKFYKSEEK